MNAQDATTLSQLTAEIVSAYVSNNAVRPEELPSLISDVHAALQRAPNNDAQPAPAPAVPIKKSITPDYLISLENGQKFRSLKRHLMNSYGLTPDEYRAKWGLPRDYPMVAPNYAKTRSELAKSLGLGRKRSETEAAPTANASGAAPRRRGRAKVAA
jgi:predicted transcriptional regulator